MESHDLFIVVCKKGRDRSPALVVLLQGELTPLSLSRKAKVLKINAIICIYSFCFIYVERLTHCQLRYYSFRRILSGPLEIILFGFII